MTGGGGMTLSFVMNERARYELHFTWLLLRHQDEDVVLVRTKLGDTKGHTILVPPHERTLAEGAARRVAAQHSRTLHVGENGRLEFARRVE